MPETECEKEVAKAKTRAAKAEMKIAQSAWDEFRNQPPVLGFLSRNPEFGFVLSLMMFITLLVSGLDWSLDHGYEDKFTLISLISGVLGYVLFHILAWRPYKKRLRHNQERWTKFSEQYKEYAGSINRFSA